MRPECIQSVEAAIGRSLKAGEAADIEARIIKAKKDLAAQDRAEWSRMPETERLTAAGKLVGEQLMGDLAKKKQRLALDILASQRIQADIDANPTLSPLNVLNRILAPFQDGQSRVQSIDTQARSIADLAKSEMLDLIDATKGAWLGFVADVKMNQNIVRELHGQQTGDAVAAKAAEQFRKTAENLRERFNRAGGQVGKLEDWAMPHSHSALRVAKAGRDQWVADTLPLMNRDRFVNEDGTLMTDQQMTDFLSEAYVTISTSAANKIEAGQFNGGGKRSNRGSEERSLHFKDGDAWLEYQAKYGEQELGQTLMGHIDAISRDIALVERLGSNPNHMLRMYLDKAEQAEKLAGGDLNAINKLRDRTERLYAEVTKANLPVSVTMADWFKAYRGINIASRLGSTTITAITDQATIAVTARQHGLAWHRIFGKEMKLLNPANAADRRTAQEVGLGINELMAGLSRYADDGLGTAANMAGKAAKFSTTAASAIMRVSALNAMTSARKQAFSMMLMNKYGTMSRNKSWDDLLPDDRKMLEGTGIKEQDWQIWQKAQPMDRDGDLILSAKDIMRISDEDILAIIDPEISRMRAEAQTEIDALNAKNQIDQDRVANRQQQIAEAQAAINARLEQYAGRTDQKAMAEQQALKDRAELLTAQSERAAAQADIDAFLLAEKQQGRIRDFLQAVEDGMHSDKAGSKADANIQRNSSIRGNIGERLGERVGNAKRRIVEIEARIRQSERDANRAIDQKTKQANQRIDRLNEELAAYSQRAADRQALRSKIADQITNQIEVRSADMIKSTREQAATRYHAHVLDEQGMAVLEAGSREQAKLYGGVQKGTYTGEIWRSALQFKSFTAALMMRHGVRMMSQEGVRGKAAYGAYFFVLATLLGGLAVQLRDLAQGNDPNDMTEKDFWSKAVLAGGGLGIYGDIIKAGSTSDGKGVAEVAGGPILGDVVNVAKIANRGVRGAMGDEDANAGTEAIKFAKSHIPAANLWYTRAATDRLIFNQLHDLANPGYTKRKEARDRAKYDRTAWWSPDDLTPDDSPDWDKAVGE